MWIYEGLPPFKAQKNGGAGFSDTLARLDDPGEAHFSRGFS